MLLCDIGNSSAKFFDGVRMWREELGAIGRYRDRKVCYISVNHRVTIPDGWIDLEPYAKLESDYRGLGIDRKVLCIAVEHGTIVDAGSAITVDVMEQGRHRGGFIELGLKRWIEAYGAISPRLRIEPRWSVDPKRLALNTQEAIEYGIVVPLVRLLEDFEPLYLTGGDAPILAKFLPHAIVDEYLIFKGMEKIVQRMRVC